MIKIFVQSLNTTDENTVIRDTRTLEDNMNNFIKNPTVTVISSTVRPHNDEGEFYLVGVIDYNPKQQ